MERGAIDEISAFCMAYAYLVKAGCYEWPFPGEDDKVYRIQPWQFMRHDYPLVMRCY